MNPTISIEGADFVLSIPGSHTIRIPLDRTDQLIRLLQARQRGALRIAEPGSPVQSMIDDRTQELGAIETFCADRRAAIFAELGL